MDADRRIREHWVSEGARLDQNGDITIKSSQRVREHAEVYTPAWLVNDMLDMLEEENPDRDIWHGTFLEPSAGNGNFLVEIARRKLAHGLTPEQTAETIFAVEYMEDNVEETIERMLELLPGTEEILRRNIVCGDFLEMRHHDGTPIWFLEEYMDSRPKAVTDYLKKKHKVKHGRPEQ